MGLQREFEIFQQMLNDNIQPNEATSTNAAKEDPEMAFELLKQMKSVDNAPKKNRSTLLQRKPMLELYLLMKRLEVL